MSRFGTRRAKIGLAAGGAAVVAGLILGVTLTVGQPAASPAPSASPSTTPSASPTATRLIPEVPRTAAVRGAVAGWNTASPSVAGRVLPEVGAAADGRLAVFIDAPNSDPGTQLLVTTVQVEPGETYSFGLSARTSTEALTTVPMTLTVGTSIVRLGQLNAAWAPVTGSYTPGPGETSVTFALAAQGSARSVSVDRAFVTDEAGVNLLPNASFEDVSTAVGIVNDSLVLAESTATVAVAGFSGEVAWRVRDASGGEVSTGDVTATGPVDAIRLDGVDQGYYSVEVSFPGGATYTTPLALIDSDPQGIPPDSRFGVVTHVDQEWYEGAARYVASLGVGVVRNDVLWEANETVAGVYSFRESYTREFPRFRANGIELMGIVDYGNPLYDSGATPYSAEAIAAYGRYAAAIAQAFDVASLEVFNEFNHERFNTGECGIAAACYLPLLRSADEAVAAVSPEVDIVAGATALYDGPWLAELWRLGGLQYADAISFHPYEVVIPPQPEALTPLVADANSAMSAASGGAPLPIWITELGWTTKTGGTELREQGAMLHRAAATALGGGVEMLVWYDLVNDFVDPASHEGNFGLFYRALDGVSALPPKPAAFAQALLIEQIGGRSLAVRPRQSEGVHSYTFGRPGDEVHVVWSPIGASTAIYPATGAVEVVHGDGSTSNVRPVGGTVTIPVGTDPVFVRTGVG